MKHETHIPTQQTKTEENFWISSSLENSRGAQSNQAPQSCGTQKTCRLKFPKHVRLRKRHEFLEIQKNGERLVGKFLCISYLFAPLKRLGLGITASSRYGKAPERSRFKRLVREVFRKKMILFPPNLKLSVAPRQKAKKAKEQEIALDLLSLIRKISPND